MQFADYLFPFLLGAVYGWALGVIPLAFPWRSATFHRVVQGMMALLVGVTFYKFIGWSSVLGMASVLTWLLFAFARADNRASLTRRTTMTSA